MDLVVEHLTFAPAHADEPILSDLSMQVEAAGLYRIAGQNGSGKSTLVELCAGWLQPTSGSVTLNGLPASTRSLHSLRRVCRAQPSLYDPMTVLQHIQFASRVRGIEPDAAIEVADRLGLTPWLDRPAGALSTGLTRKCWICVTTVGEWGIAFIDEPFSGLDAASAETLVSIFGEWSRERVIMLIDHTGSISNYQAEFELTQLGAVHG